MYRAAHLKRLIEYRGNSGQYIRYTELAYSIPRGIIRMNALLQKKCFKAKHSFKSC